MYFSHPELFGNIDCDRFPLLIKIIDAKEDLSIQVHPDDEYASTHENGSYGKTECWYIIDCPDNAKLVIGHNAGTHEELMKFHASGDDYLEAILVLQKKMGMVRSIDIARHMGLCKPSISHAEGVLKKGGFLTVDDDGFLHLTAIGREIAEKIYERHQFFTEQLIAAGVDRETAEQDACRIEHAISEDSLAKLKNHIEGGSTM